MSVHSETLSGIAIAITATQLETARLERRVYDLEFAGEQLAACLRSRLIDRHDIAKVCLEDWAQLKPMKAARDAYEARKRS